MADFSLSAQATNSEIATVFEQVADILELQKETFFRVRAYRRAAENVRALNVPVRQVWERGELDSIPGVGGTFQSYLTELFTTGTIAQFVEWYATMPAGMFPLLGLPGIGAKTAFTLASTFELHDAATALATVARLAQAGKIRTLPHFGQKSEAQILEAVTSYEQQERRYLFPVAQAVAGNIVQYLQECSTVLESVPLGSLRRAKPTVGDIDIAVLTHQPETVMEHVRAYPGVHQLLVSGEKMTRFIDASGIQVDIKTQDTAGWGSMLQHYTGSRQHNIALRTRAKEKGWSLSEHGMKKEGQLQRYDDEATLYSDLGLEFIPPELREDRGEVEAAALHHLPKLVSEADIMGDLHVHTLLDFPTSHDMGQSTVTELLEKAVALGYEYIGFSDHNPKQSGLTTAERIAAVIKRSEQIDAEVTAFAQSNASCPKVFIGLEIDIQPDGALAVEDEILDLLDYAVVSIHSQFTLDKETMTKRVLKALSHPKVRIWGHPTGRSLLKRPEIELDWEEVFAFCAAEGKLVEINSAPKRLDLPDSLTAQAVRQGVRCIINTDAHHADGLLQMQYGVATARRGWAEAKHIANTLSYSTFAKLLIS